MQYLQVKKILTAVQIVVILAVVAVLMAPSAEAATERKVSGNLVFWDQARGFQTIQDNIGIFSEVSPFWYTLDSSGNIVPYSGSTSTYEDPDIVSYLQSNGVLVIPTIANAFNGQWNGGLVSEIINDPALRVIHISNIVDMVVSKGYDGIDIDYESLAASDRDVFSSFIEDLATALHNQNKILSVNVYAKTSAPGGWDGPQSQDWTAIGQAADEVRIMIYGFHWSTSPPGPISPIAWVDDVLTFAVSVMPPEKIIQGVPQFGYDWVGNSAVDYVWTEIMDLADTNNAIINWDSTSKSPWFEYDNSGIQHTVWFENASSTDAKLELTNVHNIAGINLWRLGGQDPQTWQRIESRFGAASEPPPPPPPPPTDSEPPVVLLIDPAEGASVAKKQKLSATASDNVGVTKVEFYIDGNLFFTDTTGPFEVFWNTNKASSGSHIVRVVAYDAEGNTDFDEVTVNKASKERGRGKKK